MEYTISISPQTQRRVKDTKSIPFGVQPTEHMFTAGYSEGGWHDARITPFAALSLSPLALCLHYGQTVFEGMKAFVMQDGRISIFRPERHYERFAASLGRMCMPVPPKGLFMEALHQLVQLDAEWIPAEGDGSLYLRPFMIATEERIGIKASEQYLFLIVALPAFQYYANPLKVRVETTYSRAAEGGTGTTKCGGNYGGALYPTKLAHEDGYDQVIWTDSLHHEFIEESGTMNIMFCIEGTLVTPPLSGTILDGVTRDSLLTLARESGIQVTERRISWKEVLEALQQGKRVEAFGTGTAAVVVPIQTLAIGGGDYDCYTGEDAVMFRLKQQLYGIRKGTLPDPHQWNYIL